MPRPCRTIVLACWVLACAQDREVCCDDAGPLCTPGAHLACACTDGTSGMQICSPDGSSFEPCACALPDAGAHDAFSPVDAPSADARPGDAERCTPGDVSDCVCPDDTVSTRICTGFGAQGACRCSDGALCELAEWCNALDDDCDGTIDEGFPCPDPAVTAVTTSGASLWAPFHDPAAARTLLRPIDAGSTAATVDLGDAWSPIVSYAPDGDAYWLSSFGSALLRRAGVATTTDLAPCTRVSRIGFTATGEITNDCDDGSIVRGAQVLVGPGTLLLGVLPGGAVVVGEADPAGPLTPWSLVLFDHGVEIGRYSFAHWLGQFELSSVLGTPAPDGSCYVALLRTYLGVRQEIVVVRAEPTGVFTLVRRALLPLRLHASVSRRSIVAMPDGRVALVVVINDGGTVLSEEVHVEIVETDGTLSTLVTTSAVGGPAPWIDVNAELVVNSW